MRTMDNWASIRERRNDGHIATKKTGEQAVAIFQAADHTKRYGMRNETER